MALESLLGGAIGTALLQRTYMMQSSGNFFGIPAPLAVFDAIVEEEPVYKADITQHPVEAGTEVTDHIQLKNPTLRLRGVISNTPIDLSSSVGNLVSAGLGAVTAAQYATNLLNTGLQQASGIIGAKLLGATSGSDIFGGAADAIARSILISAYETKQIVDIVTKRQKYSSMAIEELRFPRDQSSGNALWFEMSMIQIRIVSSVSKKLGTTAEAVATTAVSPTSLGSQAAKGVSATTSNSILGAGSIIRGLFGK